jgi:hypothetical protein
MSSFNCLLSIVRTLPHPIFAFSHVKNNFGSYKRTFTQTFTRALKNVKECERQPKELQPPNQSIEGLITCKKYLKIAPAEHLD